MHGKGKFAIFTDLHLGVHQNSRTWHNIALEWVDWFVSDIKNKKISNIIFTGDFFHSRSEISVNTVHVAAELLDRLKDFNIYMIPGNHDCYYKDKADIHSLSIFRGYDNITVFDKVTSLSVDNKLVTFCPWGFNPDEIEKCDVIFGHLEIESFRMNMHKVCEHGTKATQLLKKAPLIFSGHFHLNEERTYDDGTIIYVGSPLQLDFGERDCKKGYYVIDFKDLSYSFNINEVSPVHKKILISNLVNYDKADLKELVEGNFVKIVIDKRLDNKVIDALIGNCNSYNPISLLVDPLINYDDLLDSDDQQDLSGVDISKAIVEFVNLLDIENKEEVIKNTINLYNISK